MGKRGPAPEPTVNKLARGVRTDRINPNEPTPPPRIGPPGPPEGMEPKALGHWNRLAPDMYACGLLTALDGGALARYCELLLVAATALDLVRAGLLQKGRAGELVTNPAWRIYRDVCTELRLLERELGLTPSARSTMSAMVSVPASRKAS